MPSADPKTTRARARACVILILTTLRCRIRISDSTPTQKWAFAPECSRFRCAFRFGGRPRRGRPPGMPPGPAPRRAASEGRARPSGALGGVTLEGARHTRCPGSPSRPDFVLFRLTKPKPHGWNPTEFLQRGATEPRRRVGPTHRTYAKMRAHTALAFRAGAQASSADCGSDVRHMRISHQPLHSSPAAPVTAPDPPSPQTQTDHTIRSYGQSYNEAAQGNEVLQRY